MTVWSEFPHNQYTTMIMYVQLKLETERGETFD